MPVWKTPFLKIEIGKGRMVTSGHELAILSIGTMGNYAVKAVNELAKEGLSIAHYDMRFVKPIDEALLHEIFKKFNKIVTVEDGCIMGGMGSAVLEFMSDNGYSAHVKRLGIPDLVVEHGEQKELYAECGYDDKAILVAVRELLETKSNSSKAISLRI